MASTIDQWFYDKQTRGWFRTRFASTDFDPRSLLEFDADKEDDRVVIIGSEDGYLRFMDPSATDDDGTAFSAEVVLGPFLGPESSTIILSKMQLFSDRDGGGVLYEIATGDTPELSIDDFDSTFSGDGTFSAGSSFVFRPRTRGKAVAIKLGSTTSAQWGMERLIIGVQTIPTQTSIRLRDNS